MDQIHAESAPGLVSAGDYKTIYIVITAVLYILPCYFIPKNRIMLYGIWLVFASGAAALFFINYSEFCNSVIDRYAVPGINSTTVTNLQFSPCPADSVSIMCYTQTTHSLLYYEGVVYAMATYTLFYEFMPPSSYKPTTQYFLPWAPTAQFIMGKSGILPLIYLTTTIFMYCAIIGAIFILNRKKQRINDAENERDELRAML